MPALVVAEEDPPDGDQVAKERSHAVASQHQSCCNNKPPPILASLLAGGSRTAIAIAPWHWFGCCILTTVVFVLTHVAPAFCLTMIWCPLHQKELFVCCDAATHNLALPVAACLATLMHRMAWIQTSCACNAVVVFVFIGQ